MKKATQNINSNKYFLINRSELEGRIDPHQYHFERRNAIEKLKANNDILKLKHVVKNVKKITSEINSNDTYIGLENIESNTGEYIVTNDKQSISSAGVFKKGQILFPKLRPYLNKVYLAEFDGLCSTEFHIFQSEKFNNEFLSIYLRSDLIVNQTKHLMTGNTLPRLQTEDINNLPIPKISIEKQNQIVDLYNLANIKKQKKEIEAKELLKSIDTYLLNILGLTLPKKANQIENRMFTVNFSEVVGSRFDPDYISKYEFLINQKANFDFVNLGSLTIKSPQYGANEEASNPTSKNDVRYIRITDIDEFGFLKKDKWKTAKTINEIYKLNQNDILFARSGSVGRCYIHKEIEQKAIFAGYLIRFVFDETKVLPDFIFNFCNSSIYKFWVSAIERPAVQSNINSEEFKSLPIPLPNLSKQKEIVNYITGIREQIKSLQTEAKQVLEEAKQEVEKMILG
ncbi:restriction endonuclease subunit S [Flavobacterium columnare]|uniref:restriction endonuclease subunit S n=1 Tax=Flavobacterium columnare TaxID=996 RepID=UPI00177C049E|nr:restriction endonuclease subunit S [Flavobacterium columnare]QOG89304.1 restriction endonuclease subunit S [Flavobacterium columnare]QOG91963.1 restriction endonuclease subunit S [Flavobacterium columnare]QOG94627.1 restriction endonuclease subunit S [Flavobacterium columnare]QOG97286.1 restriction endonuclease subunit S [Flavobacterium columnare]QOG99944.1 restriction endonuclease subunit S [Flavobacterium columnare]